ncbi:MAG: hypothetical protein Q9210_000499 [Variospora velana]
MSEITSSSNPNVAAQAAATTASAEDHFTLLKTLVKHSDLDSVKSALSTWRAANTTTSTPVPTAEQINYLVPQAASGDGHPETLAYLLSELGGKIDTHAIMLARSPAIFDVFITHGWEVDNSMLYSKIRHPDLIAWFLSHGADPNASGPGKFAPLDVAALHASLETVKLLVDHGAKVGEAGSGGALHAAAQGDAPDRIAVMEFLVENGADINGIAADITAPSEARRAGRKGTPLHTAYKWANEEAKVWLVGHGADAEARNQLGETPEEWGRRFDEHGPERVVRLRRAVLRKRRKDGVE